MQPHKLPQAGNRNPGIDGRNTRTSASALVWGFAQAREGTRGNTP
jgi:hypothetical protein